MDFKETRACRIISTILVFLFTWTSVGGNELAFAAKAPEASKESTPAYKAKEKSDAARHSEAIEGMRKALKDKKLSYKDKKGRVASLMKEVDALDGKLRAEFDATEKRLKDKGLSRKIRKRHSEFVKHYERNMAELKKNAKAIKDSSRGNFSSRAEAALKHLDKVKPPKRHSPFDPNKLPNRVTKEKKAPVISRSAMNYDESYDYYAELESDTLDKPVLLAATGSLNGLLDPGYLAETVEVQFSQEITDLAAELEHNPLKMYEWVRNYIKYEPYYGSIKGARQTLLEKAGNDYDQASLLIALLRTSGIPARYASGTIEMPVEKAMNWVGGAKTSQIAGKIFATNSVPSKLLLEGSVIKHISLEQVWVEAYVDMEPSMGTIMGSGGKRWTPVSPSFKEMYVQEGKDIAKELPFDEEAYLSHLTNTPPLAEYLYQLDDYYTSVYNGFFIESLHGAVVEPKRFEIFAGTLPYKVKSVSSKFAEVPSTLRHTVGLGLKTESSTLVSVNKPLAEIAGRKVTLSYTPASEIDSDTIASYGGLLNTPAYLIAVKPEIKLDDVVILTGEPLTLGTGLSLRTELDGPAANWPRAVDTKEVSYGIHFALGITALDYPSKERANNSSQMIKLEGLLSDSLNALDNRAGFLLQNMVIEYFGQLETYNNALEGIHNVLDVKMPSLALLSATVGYDESFGVAVSPPIMDGFTTDAYYLMSSSTALNGEAASRKAFLEQSGLASSYLEHKTIENLIFTESLSTVKLLQISNDQNISIVTINSGNIDSILTTLSISQEDKRLIQDAINSGKEVVTSESEISYKTFNGLGLIVRNPVTGEGAYLISEGYGGARAAFKNCLEQAKANPNINIQNCSDPSYMGSGGRIALLVGGTPINLYDSVFNYPVTIADEIEEAVLAVTVSGIYIPQIYHKKDKNELIDILNEQAENVWIFYYAGHGSEDTFDWIDVNDIALNFWKTKAKFLKLVYFNSCASAEGDAASNFSSAFGVDDNKNYYGKDRNEDYIGIKCIAPNPRLGEPGIEYGRIDTKIATKLSLRFWHMMGMGMNVEYAALLTRSEKQFVNEECVLGYTNGKTTLYDAY